MQSSAPNSAPPSNARGVSPRSYERLHGRTAEPSPLSQSHVTPASAGAALEHSMVFGAASTDSSPRAMNAERRGATDTSSTSSFSHSLPEVGHHAMAGRPVGSAGTPSAMQMSSSATGSPADSARSSPLATPRADPTVRKPVRNVSAPDPPMSPPQSPADGSAPSRPTAAPVRPGLAPRNSSMDSSASVASASSQQPQDPSSPNPAEIAAMIAAAGSAEALIKQLVKEKKHAANQNAQLFRLVQKQRSLIYGLNQDLEKAAQEKDKFKQRIRDESAHMSPARGAKVDALRRDSPAGSTGTASVHSEDELPIQRHSTNDDDAPVTRLPQTSMQQESETTRASSEALQPPTPAQQPPKAESDHGRSPITPIAPLRFTKRSDTTDTVDLPDSAGPSQTSFAARRNFAGANNAPQISPPTSAPEEEETSSPTARKGPPAPLQLGTQSNEHFHSPQRLDHSGSEYEEGEIDQVTGMERGRKKTREEDDIEREIIVKYEQESRSLSKKKSSKSGSSAGHQSQHRSHSSMDQGYLEAAQYPLPKSPMPDSTLASPAGSIRSTHLSPHASIAGVLGGRTSQTKQTIVERYAGASPPMSPGLPVSPRPVDRPIGAPIPRKPREGYVTGPQASPSRSPNRTEPRKHQTNLSVSSSHDFDAPQKPPKSPGRPPRSIPVEQAPAQVPAQAPPEPRSPVQAIPQSPMSPRSARRAVDGEDGKPVPGELMVAGVYRGLVHENLPTLLLPPNALPTICIKVTSSRLKPSRQSTIMLAGAQEEPVFTLGVTAKSNSQQLWRVEKPIMSLPKLDHQLKQVGEVEVKLPDRSLFSGHAPAKIDARRSALEHYFDELLDMQMNEQMGLIICKYFSTHVIPCEDTEQIHTANTTEAPQAGDAGGLKIIKEGYLTKRGKQFGGWKARYFVLDEPILRYYDAPGGTLQGSIKLFRAQIGRQSTHTSHSPSRENPDNQFRHAFLIMEPKKRDTSSHVRHVLCAESDQERDEWVFALLQYVNSQPDDGRPSSSNRNASGMKGAPAPEADRFNSLQAVSYENTNAGEAPKRSVSDPRVQDSASQFGSSHGSSQGPPISGPRNGAVIQDAGAWGNKGQDQLRAKDKETKKRSIFGFRDRLAEMNSHASQKPPPPTPHQPHQPTPTGFGNMHKDTVFGVPLKEAVEFCRVPESNLCLPAVVYRCLTYLDAKGAAQEEGIFRLSGSNTLVRQLKARFNTDGDFDFLAEDTYYDVHAVASLLKLYLRELPNTVLTRPLHMEFLSALDIERKEDRLEAYCVLVHRLPLANWTLVRCLSEYLLTVTNNAQINKMSVRNVGIVFAPTLNIPAAVFASFLTDHDAIFNTEPPEDAPDTYIYEPNSAVTQGSDDTRGSDRHPSFGEHVQTPLSAGPPNTAGLQSMIGLPSAPNDPQRHPERYSYMPGRGPTPSQIYTGQMPYETGRRPSNTSAGMQTPHTTTPYESFTPGTGTLPPPSHYHTDLHRRPSNSSVTSNPPSAAALARGQAAPPQSYETALPHPDTNGFSYNPMPKYAPYESAPGPPPQGPPPQPPQQQQQQPRQSTLVTPQQLDRPKYASGIGQLEVMRDAKARRRESAMVMVGASGGKKNSPPFMGNMPESVAE